MKDSETILYQVFLARFGRALALESDERIFFEELRSYHKIIRNIDTVDVTVPAIRNWFFNKKATPKRIEAMRFLHGYMLWLKTSGYVSDEQAYTTAMSRLAPYGVTTHHPKSCPPSWEGDNDTWKSAHQLEGVFQIIRPSAKLDKSESNRAPRPANFVLEIMSIDLTSDPESRVLMYSYKSPTDSDYIYSGSLFKSTWSMFSMLGRRNSNIETRKSYRCVSICIGFPAHCECFSGMIMRSMSDDSGYGKRIMSVPFVAIRSGYKTNVMRNGFSEIPSTELRQLKNGLLVGQLAKTDSRQARLFAACSQLFATLEADLHAGSYDERSSERGGLIVTSASDNEHVHAAVRQALGVPSNYFQGWEKLVSFNLFR